MWFTREQIHTKALDFLVGGNRSYTEKELEEFIVEQFHTLEVNELYYSTNDLIEELNKANVRVSKSYISTIISEHFKLVSKNSCYKLYRLDLSNAEAGSWSVFEENRKGRFFTFKKQDFVKQC